MPCSICVSPYPDPFQGPAPKWVQFQNYHQPEFDCPSSPQGLPAPIAPVVSPAPGSRWILMNRPPNDSRTCHIQHSQTALITPGSHWAPVNPGSQNILVLASSCSLPFLLWSQDPSQAPRTGASCKCCKARLPYRAHTKPTTTKPGFQPTPAPGQFP